MNMNRIKIIKTECLTYILVETQEGDKFRRFGANVWQNEGGRYWWECNVNNDKALEAAFQEYNNDELKNER